MKTRFISACSFFARKCLPICQNVIASTAFSQLVTPPERFLRGIDEFATTLFAWGLCCCSDVMNQFANHTTSLPSRLGRLDKPPSENAAMSIDVCLGIASSRI
jgi:hypothetical protein